MPIHEKQLKQAGDRIKKWRQDLDYITFFSNMIRDLAWPTSIVIILIILARNRDQIAKLIKSIKYKDMEVTLREDFQKAKEMADKVKNENNIDNFISSENVMKLSQIDPGVAILRSWQRLEEEARRFTDWLGVPRFFGAMTIFRSLYKNGIFGDNENDLYYRLNQIRNDVVHGNRRGEIRTPTAAEAVEFDELVTTLSERLNLLKKDNRLGSFVETYIKENSGGIASSPQEVLAQRTLLEERQKARAEQKASRLRGNTASPSQLKQESEAGKGG